MHANPATPPARRSIRPAVVAAWTALLLTLATVAPATGAQPLPRIEVHPGGHHLQTADGRPFFWLGDTAWKLLQSATPRERAYYLRIRAAQGFNVIQTVALAENESILTPNALGRVAFVDGDLRRPDEAFFDNVVAAVDDAARLGLYVALVPTWGDKLTAPWGTGPRIFRNDNLADAEAFGAYLGGRLRDRTNVIWMIGGDRPSRLAGVRSTFLRDLAQSAGFPPDQDWTPIWAAMVRGLAQGLGRDPVCLYHPQGGEYSSSRQLPTEPWVDIHAMQSGHGGGRDVPVWEWIARDYAMEPRKPTLDIEPNYEDHPYNPWPAWDPATGWFRDHDVRKQCYRSVFAGGAGVTYGHHAVWQMASKRNGVINHADRDWVDALHRPAARQMVHLRSLIESRPAFDRRPDPALLVGAPGPRSHHAVACRDDARTYAFVYVPERDQTIRVAAGAIRDEQLRAWWYDPRTGFAEEIGILPADREHTFTTPSHGPDWVLVLDAASASYAPPGAEPALGGGLPSRGVPIRQ